MIFWNVVFLPMLLVLGYKLYLGVIHFRLKQYF